MQLIYFTYVIFTCVSSQMFNVRRYASIRKDGDEPYIPVNTFLNENNICYFSYCYNLKALCTSSSGCCQCMCKDGSTFFSQYAGCQTPKTLQIWTKAKGVECSLYSSTFGNQYVPLFFDQKKFINIKLSLFKEVFFPFHVNTTTCSAGHIYEYDYHAHQILYHRNECSSMFNITFKEGYHFLHYTAKEDHIWKNMKGKLFSVNIDCKFKEESLSSCFLFQVEGTFFQGAHSTEPPTLAPDFSCDMILDNTTTKLPNIATTLTTKTMKAITSTILTTTENISIKVILNDKEKSEETAEIGLAVGVTVGVVLLMLIILVVVLLQKKFQAKKDFRTNDVLLPPVNPQMNRYEQTYSHYAVPDEALLSNACSNDNGEQSYLKPINNTDYQYIANLPPEETHDYEPTNDICIKQPILRHNSSCRSNTNMKKRPLPEKPIETINPYYYMASGTDSEKKDSCTNDLYRIYSSLDDAI